MAFHNMPDLGAMLLPGAAEYAGTLLDMARSAAQSVDHAFDIAYGPDPFQQLDIWLPAGAPAEPVPVLVMIHGGVYRNGHKEWMGAPAAEVTALPAILVSLNYRLIPRAHVPDCVADCFAALAWVYRNIAGYGGDPDRLHVGGHSAGGHLAALLALDRRRLDAHGIPPRAIRSCLPISAPFTLTKAELDPAGYLIRLHPEMFAAEGDAGAVSAYPHAAGNRVPFFIAWGERDVAELLPDNERMVAVARRGAFLEGSYVAPGADHFGAHLACVEPGGAWSRTAARLIRG